MSTIEGREALDAARRSHVLEYLGQHPDGATAREIHAAAVESGEAEVLRWDPRFADGPLVALMGLFSAGEVTVTRREGEPLTLGALDTRYRIAQMALL